MTDKQIEDIWDSLQSLINDGYEPEKIILSSSYFASEKSRESLYGYPLEFKDLNRGMYWIITTKVRRSIEK